MKLQPLLLASLVAFSLPVYADCVLRQSDAVELQFGPFVDSTDGVTAETALTISQADVRLSKCTAAGDCGAWAQANDATSATHGENGWYEKDFNTTDTDTVGILMIAINETGALPVFKECLVVETAIYDSIYADGIGGLATAAALNTVDDFVDTEVASIITTLGTPTNFGSGATLSDNFDDVEGQTDDIGVAGAGLTALPDVDTLLEALVVLGAEQTADSGTTTTAVDAALTQATNDWFKGMGIHFTSGTLLGQDACVTGFTAASDTLTFAPAVTTAVTTHTYYLLPNSECFSGASGSGATAQEVWEYATRGLTVLDEDTTTIDLNNTTIGTLATLDEDTTTLDLNTTAFGSGGSITGTVGAIATGGILATSFDNTGPGPFAALGVTDMGTAQSATSTTLVLRAANPFSSDDAIKGQTLWAYGSDQAYWQSELITGYVAATDTASVNTWDVTPSGALILYRVFGTPESAAGAGGGATAQEVWEYATRVLTSLDEDVTTLDLDATTVGTLTTLDEDTTTFDLNATTIGTVTTATNVTTVNGLAAGVVNAAAVATGAFDADAAAADLSTEIWSAATRSLTILDEDSTTLDLDASTIGTATNVGGSSLRTGLGMSSANLDTQLAGIESGVDVDTIEGVDATDAIDARLLAFLATQGILAGTCDSGSTTTCVDDALTQAAEAQIDDHLICFPTDSFCAMVTGFTPGTDTVTITKTAPSTRASKTYILWPSTLQ